MVISGLILLFNLLTKLITSESGQIHITIVANSNIVPNSYGSQTRSTTVSHVRRGYVNNRKEVIPDSIGEK